MFELKRSLEEIEKSFVELKESNISKSAKDKGYIKLMDELEGGYHTFIFNPTQEELEQPAVILYRKISAARS